MNTVIQDEGKFDAMKECNRGLGDRNISRGMFIYEAFDKDGNLKWREEVYNMTTTAGLNKEGEVMFRGDTPIASWFCGLVDNAGFTAFAAADVMSSHGGWTESVAYSNTLRQQWSPGAFAGGIASNSATMNFSINTDGTVIKGGFITSGSAKSGSTGTLWATGAFSAAQTLNNGDTLKITYTLTKTGS